MKLFVLCGLAFIGTLVGLCPIIHPTAFIVPERGDCAVANSAIYQGDAKAEAVAIVRAMGAHDASIYSIEWKSDISYPDGHGWKVYQTAEHGMDEMGRWYSHVRFGVEQSPGSLHFFFVHTWTSDGNVQYLYNEDSRLGAIQPPDRGCLWTPSPVMFLGRLVALNGRRSLSDLMLEGTDLRISKPENDIGVVQVTALVDTGGMIGDVEIDIDITKGFMPIRYRLRDALMQYPVEEWTVTRAQLLDGVYVPVEGYRDTYYASLTQEDGNKLEAALDQIGLDFRKSKPDPRVLATRQRYHDAVRLAFGEQGVPHLPVWKTQRLGSTQLLSLNSHIPDDRFVAQIPAGISISDSFHQIGHDGLPIESPEPVLKDLP